MSWYKAAERFVTSAGRPGLATRTLHRWAQIALPLAWCWACGPDAGSNAAFSESQDAAGGPASALRSGSGGDVAAPSRAAGGGSGEGLGAGGAGYSVFTPPAAGAASGAGGAQLTGGGGAAGAGVALTCPVAPAVTAFPDLPIPILYVGMTDPARGVTQFAAEARYSDCPQGAGVGHAGKEVYQAIWSDCVADLVTAEMNVAYQELLRTDQVIFRSLGYTASEYPEYSAFSSLEEVESALGSLRNTELNAPGRFTAIISNWSHQIGGLAPRDQPLDAAHGVVLALSQVAAQAVIHEVGHAVGFEHTDEDNDGDGVMAYDFCGPVTAPLLQVCNCETNWMEAAKGNCPACESRSPSFMTETHGAFFREVASCWFSERRFAGARTGCGWVDLADCEGYDNELLDCTCKDGVGHFQVSDCVEVEDFGPIYETCGVTPDSVEACVNATAYPGVYCYPEGDGTFACDCFGESRPFASDKSCEQLTEGDVFGACFDEPVLETCEGTAENGKHMACVVTADSTMHCICTDTGASLSYPPGKTCGEVDLRVQAASCPEP